MPINIKIGVFAWKGGVGKTTVAFLIYSALRKFYNLDVVSYDKQKDLLRSVKNLDSVSPENANINITVQDYDSSIDNLPLLAENDINIYVLQAESYSVINMMSIIRQIPKCVILVNKYKPDQDKTLKQLKPEMDKIGIKAFNTKLKYSDGIVIMMNHSVVKSSFIGFEKLPSKYSKIKQNIYTFADEVKITIDGIANLI